MQPVARKVTTLFVAAVAIALTTSAAWAIEIDPAGRITAAGQDIFFVGQGGPAIEFTCNFELVGTLAPEAVDAEGAHLGETTGGELEECSAGSMMLFGEPETWEITYAGNTLPSSPARVIMTQHDLRLEFDILSFSCLYQGDVDFILQDEEEGAGIRAQTLFLEEAPVSKASGSFFCPPEGFLDGDFQLNAAQTLEL